MNGFINIGYQIFSILILLAIIIIIVLVVRKWKARSQQLDRIEMKLDRVLDKKRQQIKSEVFRWIYYSSC
ncbi:MAG: hypothetical protein LRY73_10160 [Bacillus sp. (in: Bacteria)]|nr:hypothetical protein [Bacillus sp. (in: firmicutes)]